MIKKRFLKITIFCVIFYVLQYIIGSFLICDYTFFGRAVMHNMYEVSEIDGIFLGNSHTYRAINPEIMDKKLGFETFVLASPGIELDGSLALLKEAYNNHPEIKEVYVDIDFVHLNNPPIKDKNDFHQIWRIARYIKNPRIKYDYFFHTIPPKNYFDIILKIGKNKIVINPKKIKKTVLAKLNGNYYKYIYPNSSDLNNIYKGYIGKDPEDKEEKNPLDEVKMEAFSEDKINTDWYGFVQNIIDYCRNNNLKLIFYSLPESLQDIMNIGNYDDYSNFLKKYFKSKNCVYYDLNLCKNEYLSLTTSDYYDSEHLNTNGSKKVCNVIAELILNDEKQINNMFYDSFDQRIASENENVFGFNIIESDDMHSLTVIPITNKKENSVITYDYYFISSKNNKQTLLQNTSTNRILYPQKSKGKIEINCYLNGMFVNSISKDFDTRWFR